MIGSVQNNVNFSKENPKKKHKVGFFQGVAGIAGGIGTGFVLSQVLGQAQIAYTKKFFKNGDDFSIQDKENFVKEADNMINEAELPQKGFKGIILVDFEKELAQDEKISLFSKDILSDIDEEIPKIEKCQTNISKKLSLPEAGVELTSGIFKIFGKSGSTKDKIKLCGAILATPLIGLSRFLTGLSHPINTRKEIKNKKFTGGFDPLSNRIFSSEMHNLLHEAGHAINKNKNTLTRLPLNLSILTTAILIPLVILRGVFTDKSIKDNTSPDKKEGWFKKVKDFTREHIGLTIAALSAPTLLEEVMASSRAAKFAEKSKLLSEEAKKQHKKLLKLALGSHILNVAILASVPAAAIFIKDKIIEHFSQKDD